LILLFEGIGLGLELARGHAGCFKLGNRLAPAYLGLAIAIAQ
jgi:hypothetical protein